MALVYYFFDPHGLTDDPHLSTVITTTMVVVLISILIFGAATKPLVAWLMGPDDRPARKHGQHGASTVQWGGDQGVGRPRLAACAAARAAHHLRATNACVHAWPAVGRCLKPGRRMPLTAVWRRPQPQLLQEARWRCALVLAAAATSTLSWALAPTTTPTGCTATVGGIGSMDRGRRGRPHACLPRLHADRAANEEPLIRHACCPAAADPQWSDMQQALPPGDDSRLATPPRPGRLGPALDDEFGPMAAAPARTSSGGLAEVSIHRGSGDGADADAGKGKQPAGGRPAIELTVDSSTPGAGPAGAGPSAAAISGVAGREESGGLEYAPDSKAVMARINRWWKKLDEGYMQPHFGGPSCGNSSTNLQAMAPAPAAAAPAPQHAVHHSKGSFSVPPRMVG